MKKGFTLIELLAVIVILAIVGLIITPIILNQISSARLKAAQSSAQIYVNKAKDLSLINQLDDNYIIEDEITIYNLNKENITVSKQPDFVCIRVNKETGVSGKLKFGSYYFQVINDETTAIEKEQYDLIFNDCPLV